MSHDKGWGVRSWDTIKGGSLVCIMHGRITTWVVGALQRCCCCCCWPAFVCMCACVHVWVHTWCQLWLVYQESDTGCLPVCLLLSSSAGLSTWVLPASTSRPATSLT
jgi:hypothetical protein